MTIENQGQAMELLINAIPYPNQMKDIDLRQPDAIYFTWRSGRYKLELSTGSVDLSKNGCLIGDDCSILLRRLIEVAKISTLLNKKP